MMFNKKFYGVAEEVRSRYIENTTLKSSNNQEGENQDDSSNKLMQRQLRRFLAFLRTIDNALRECA